MSSRAGINPRGLTASATVGPAIHNRNEFQARRAHCVQIITHKRRSMVARHWHRSVKYRRRLSLVLQIAAGGQEQQRDR
jgi:hypothetical protein